MDVVRCLKTARNLVRCRFRVHQETTFDGLFLLQPGGCELKKGNGRNRLQIMGPHQAQQCVSEFREVIIQALSNATSEKGKGVDNIRAD